jgi:glutathione S-transferase
LITVHHLNNSRSQRVLWLLEELGCRYQVQKYQRDPRTLLAPPELRHTYWLHYAEGSAMPPLLLKLVFQRLPRQAPALLRPLVRAIARRAQRTFIDPQLRTHIDYWESELSRDRWFAGTEFTAADIQMSLPLEAAAARSGVPLGDKVRGFLARIRARPAHQRALQAGGGFELPGAVPAR